MKIQSRKLKLFSIAAGLLVSGVCFQALKAEGVTKFDCGSKLLSGKTYHTYHQGYDLAYTGLIRINRTYQCNQGTCFKAQMTFDNYTSAVDVAEGFWTGSYIQFTRTISPGNTPQNWSGECLANSVRGEWYFPSEPQNRGLAAITY